MKKLDKIKYFTQHCENRKDAIRKAKAIVDEDVIEVGSSVSIFNDSYDFSILHDQMAFIEQYDKWIHSSKKFKIKGLDKFPIRLVTNGITDAFTDFYENAIDLNVFRGEYTYHKDLGIPVLESFSDIEENMFIIISYPFSATGNVHHDWSKIMRICEKKNCEVFIDCCLFGVSEVEALDLSYDCITHVAFSFSKTFSTGGLRTGILYKKLREQTPLQLQNEHYYTQMAGMKIHSELMKEFSPDYMCNKYRDKQVELCKKLEIEPSDSVIFGISNKEEHKHFERDGYINRLCLSYALQEHDKKYEDFE
tara:strand:- start:9307 stop:10227 length:921 start_codon:yes stop_codon:yes gene_type:complete